jgi:hypothetical protein
MSTSLSIMDSSFLLEAVSMANDVTFPLLERWMIQNPDPSRELSVSTRERYLQGGLPASLVWFLRNPGALEALAKDARKLTAKELDHIQTKVEARSSKQRKYREERTQPIAEVPAASARPRRKAS